MMQTIPKWKVTVYVGEEQIVFWIYNSHMGNVLRQVADMQFTSDGLVQPLSVYISQ